MKAPAERRQEHSSMVLLTVSTEATGNKEHNKHVSEERGFVWHVLHHAESVKDLEIDINSVST